MLLIYDVRKKDLHLNFAELQKLIDRVNRFSKKLKSTEGTGTKWSHTFENGETHFYTIDGVRPPEEIEDDITSMFLWLWSLKDYVQKYVNLNGKSKTWVKDKITSDSKLCICADIANSLKHGGLDKKHKPWSEKNPKLSNLKYSFPQEAIGELIFDTFDVNIKIINPHLVKLEMEIEGNNKSNLGDAFVLLQHVLLAWENIVNEANKTV